MPVLFPEIIALTKNRDLERLTISIRRYFGEGGGLRPFLNMDNLLKQVDLPVVFQKEGFGAIAMDDRKATLQSVMRINSNLSFLEERFLKAHLLGHYILHLQSLAAEGEQAVLGFADQMSPMERFARGDYDIRLLQEKKEQEADFFAAALLMPKAMFEHAFTSLGSASKTAHFFGVSDAVVVARKKIINLASTPEKSVVSLIKQPSLKTQTSSLASEEIAKSTKQKTLFSKEQAKKLSLEKLRAIARRIDQTVA